MKKLIFLLLLFASPAFAIDDAAYNYSQGTSTRTLCTTPCTFYGVVVTSSVGTAFTVYDSTWSGDTTVPIAVFPGDIVEDTYIFNARTQNGLQMNGAASGNQTTVIFR